MQKIEISTDSKRYPVLIGEGVIHKLSTFIIETFPKLTKILIVTDETVSKIHLDTLRSVLKEFKHCVYVTPSGEASKTFEVYYQVQTFALEEKLDRNSILLALGGGSVGDLGGFVAATYMRGIPFVQIPTTILAHDSAVGGKVAINHPKGKNMIGCFYQPGAVFYDLSFLKTLNDREKRSGFSEVIKHSLIQHQFTYDALFNNIKSLDQLNSDNLLWLLSAGIKVKGDIVQRDETEKGERAFLNFGHTLGHAIEAELGYGNMTHGEAVAIGMIFAIKVSMKIQGLQFNLEGFKEWLVGFGFETSLPKSLAISAVVERMKQDKKAQEGIIKMVLLSRVGEPTVQSVAEEVVRTLLSEL